MTTHVRGIKKGSDAKNLLLICKKKSLKQYLHNIDIFTYNEAKG